MGRDGPGGFPAGRALHLPTISGACSGSRGPHVPGMDIKKNGQTPGMDKDDRNRPMPGRAPGGGGIPSPQKQPASQPQPNKEPGKSGGGFPK